MTRTILLGLVLLCAFAAVPAQAQRPPPAPTLDDADGIRISAPPPPPSPPPKPQVRPPAKPAAHTVVDAGARGPIQLAPASSDGESMVVEALEVIARASGPAMWTVSKGDSQVVILGSYSPLPHLLDWDKGRLSRALDGAGGYYETRATINPLELAGLFFDQGAFKLSGGRKLDAVIGPARKERLARITAMAKADPARMQPFKPAIAGIFAYQSFLRAVGFSGEKPATTIRKLVGEKHVPRRPLAKLGGASIIRSVQRMDEAAQLACFDASLDQIEWESGHAVAAARAWADGRVSELLRQRSTAILDHCLLDVGSAKAVLEKGVSDSTASIEDVLNRPGRSVASIDMEFLTPRNGVLDRLKAKGYEIGVPPN